MVAKIRLVFVFTFLLVQVILASPLRQKRDTDAGKAIDDAVENIKSNFDSLLKNIENNDLFKDLSDSVQKLGESIQTHGKDLVDKIQASVKQ